MNNNNCFINNEMSIKGNYWNFNKTSNKDLKTLMLNYNLSDTIAKIIIRRQLDENDFKYLVKPTLKNSLPDPCILKNMKATINVLVKKILGKNIIGLLGDYDVDGATSTAILYRYFKCIGCDSEVFIPDRIQDGYGISKNSINYFLKKNIKFLIALDCGTNDHESIAYAKENGINIIVIDHHEVENLGEPLSIINPKLKEDQSDLEILCTAGLAFLFIIGLNRELRKQNFFKTREEPNLKKFLDIVAVGTVCDLVPLKKINRLLVKKGLELINFKANKGLDILKQKLYLENKIKSSDLAFYLGPCINAAGRIGNSYLGFQLLTNEKKEELEVIADKLIESNNQRKTIEILAYEKAKELINLKNNRNFIFLSSQNWHPGIVGIVASKLVEDYKIPAFVMSIISDKVSGSVRSVKGIDISKILAEMIKLGLIDSGGGHAMAGGFKLKKNNLNKLMSYLENNNSIFFKTKKNVINIDLRANIDDLNIQMIESLEELEPYGMGNPEPKILIQSVNSVYSKKIGQDNKHLSCTLEDVYGKKIKAIAFNAAYKKIGQVIEKKKRFDVIGKVSINEWYNKKTPQFFIEDLKLL